MFQVFLFRPLNYGKSNTIKAGVGTFPEMGGVVFKRWGIYPDAHYGCKSIDCFQTSLY